MIHACRCGGTFVLNKDDFDDIQTSTGNTDELNIIEELTCELEIENCECHEIVEVECETCSLVIGVKISIVM